ncbi:unnamed protein product [Medioppia subpectinata]|uniref:Uncharacterized protein n=1 Tax=Medioppia subpectinata TaxID=1979941 RepID=A0A7R9PZR0_9ACAR|nr:unnamed protein product [Medioppia subpectinata]CAG2106715.1 unnamed protein product [Medioppia subpectinata]
MFKDMAYELLFNIMTTNKELMGFCRFLTAQTISVCEPFLHFLMFSAISLCLTAKGHHFLTIIHTIHYIMGTANRVIIQELTVDHNLPHHYVYHTASTPSYIPAAPSLLLPPSAALSPTHFYDYPTTAYPPPPPYATATNGFDAYTPFHPSHSHQSGGPLGSAAVAAAVAAAASGVGNGGAQSAHSGSHHPFSTFTTLSGSGGLATNGSVATTGANYMAATVTPTNSVSYISDARMQ